MIELLSVVIQVTSFKLRRKRVFPMTPLHHSFELMDWAEVTITIRFWIIAGFCVVIGIGVFYGNYAAHG